MSRAGLVGTVVIEFIIDKTGGVVNPFISESNNPWFERPAIDAILQWKFTPGMINGQPVNVLALQKIEFNVDSGGRVPALWRVSRGKDHGKLPPQMKWDTPPSPKFTAFPVYPFEQLKDDVSGKAKVTYVIGPAGQVVQVRLDHAASPEFGAAVVAMIEAWRFEPAKMKDGKACFATLSSEYDFRPNGRGDVPVSDSAKQILSSLGKNPEVIATSADLDAVPKLLSSRPPVYPTALSEKRTEGEALIEFYIDKKGDVQLPRIVSSSVPEFGHAAVQAVATWRFEPPKKKGKAVTTRVHIPIKFSQDSTLANRDNPPRS